MSANSITVLRPAPTPGSRQTHVGQARKRIASDGRILDADNISHFDHKTIELTGIKDLHQLVTKLAPRNMVVVRGHPATDVQPIHRRLAHRLNRGNNGFEDVPKLWAAWDLDGLKLPALTDWREDPIAAVDYAVGRLPECFWDASYSWSFTATHGLERVTKADGQKYWTGNFVGDTLRLRLWFWLSRAVGEDELRAWMNAMGDLAPVDSSVAGPVHMVYTSRPLAAGGSDPLAGLGVPLSGFRQGLEDAVIVPDDLAAEARWSRAEGHGAACASHPSAEAAIASIGKPSHPKGRAEIRSHMMSAAFHLARNERDAGRAPDPAAIHARIVEAIEQHRDEISRNLKAGGRNWGEVSAYAQGGNLAQLCRWIVERIDDDDAKAQDGGGKRKRVERVQHAPKLDGVVFVDQAEARAVAAVAVEDFVTAAKDYMASPKTDEHGAKVEAPQHLLALPTGSGKTEAAIQGVKELAQLGCVAWAVPTHRLGDEAAARIRAAAPGVSVVVRRGLEQTDPDQPGKMMCHRVEDARDVLEHGLRVSETLCRPETTDASGAKKVTYCPFHSKCGYQRQKAVVAMADVVVLAHTHLFQGGVPDEMSTPVAVFVDEDPMGGAVGGVDAPVAVGLGSLLSPPSLVDGELAHWRKEIGKALAAEPDGPVRREVLAAWSSTAVSARKAERALVRGLPAPVTKLTGAELRAKLEKTLGGTYGPRNVRRMLAFWRAVGSGAALPDGARSGRMRLFTTDAETGAREIRVTWKAELGKGWRKVPMMLMDATADVTVLRQVFERIKDAPRYAVRNANVQVRQVVDRSFAHATLVPPPEAVDADGKKRKTAQNNAAKVLAKLVADAVVRYGGQDVLAVVPMGVEAQWRATATLPPWLHLLHHGAVSGIDAYRNARAVYIIGRILPDAGTVERVAGALTGVAVEATGYRVTESIIATTGGKGVATRAMKHPDALAEAIRRQKTEAGLVQAAGRIRAINRTADTPADINLWVDVAVPELGEVKPALWQGPTIDETMLAKGAWFARPSDAVKAWPDLGSPQAVEMARARADAHICFKDTLKQMLGSGTILLRYRLAKARSGSAQAVYRGADPAAARRFLEDKLGPLAEFEVIKPARPPEAEAPRPAAAQPADPAPPPRPSPPPKPTPKPVAPLPGLGAPTTAPPPPAPFSGLTGLKTVARAGSGAIITTARTGPPRSLPPWLAAAASPR